MTDISWCTIKSNDDGQCVCPKCSLVSPHIMRGRELSTLVVIL